MEEKPSIPLLEYKGDSSMFSTRSATAPKKLRELGVDAAHSTTYINK